MNHSERVLTMDRHVMKSVPESSSLAPTTGITIYGCTPGEAVILRELATRLDVVPTITSESASEANTELAAGNRCISVGHKVRLTNSTVRALRDIGVSYISTRSIGYNHIDVEYAESIGISVGNVSYSPGSVADYTLMLLLMSVRDAKSIVHHTDTHDYRLNVVRGKELRDLTVGVVGTGRIGSAVIDRLRGFGSRILANDRTPKIEAEYVPLDALLEQSDVVTLHTPLNPGTHHLLSRERIEKMKPGAFVLNTGRGALIDTEALTSALESGYLGGAALDVVEGEEGVFYTDRRNKPIEGTLLARLSKLPNVLISPHTAYYTDRAVRDMVENSIINCLKFESVENYG